jgi:NAD(P)H-hydrate epimerase
MNGTSDPGYRRLYTFAECRDLDRLSQAAGFSEIQLMGQAALASLYALDRAGTLSMARRLLILCGPGNNGGDGYALAYMLAGRASPPALRIYATAPPRSAAAQFYANQVQELSDAGSDVQVRSGTDFLREQVQADDLVIEALLGTGQSGPPRDLMAELVERLLILRATPTPVPLVSLDLPVGLCETATTGPGPLVPDEIHSYGVDKTALRLHQAIAAHARVQVLPMGFLPQRLPAGQTGTRSLTPQADGEWPVSINKEPWHHKYSAGHGLLIGGSPGMEGALIMAARAFFAAGGGILHALVPDVRSREFLTGLLPGVMFLDYTRPLPDALRPPAAIAVGPGLADADRERAAEYLWPLLQQGSGQRPQLLVLDAGALELIHNRSLLPTDLRPRTLLTPHSGEWQRLGGAAVACTADLDTALADNAERFGCYSLIKNSISVLLPADARDGAGLWHRPNPALAVAGSGDNLTGILLALGARRRAAVAPIPDLVATALGLLGQAAARRHHPQADEFSDLIRDVLRNSGASARQAES